MPIDPVASGTRQQRLRVLTWVSLGVALVAGEWAIVITDAQNAFTWWALSPFIIAPAAAALKCFHTARRLTGVEKKAWRAFGLACSAYTLSEATRIGGEAIAGVTPPFFSISGLAYYVFAFYVLAGFWHYQNRDSTAARNLVQAGNLGIILSSILLAYLFLYYELVRSSVSTSDFLTNFTDAIIALILPSFGFLAAVFQSRGSQRKVMFLVLLGLIAYAGSFFNETRNLLDGDRYPVGDPLGGFFMLTFTGFFLAALEQDRLESTETFLETPGRFLSRVDQWQTLLPSLAVAGVLSIAVVFREDLNAMLLPYVAMASVLFIASLAVRNWWGRRLEVQMRVQAKSSEDDLQRANRELLQEMETRERAQEQLQQSQKTEVLGQITGEVAKDFDDLLTVILGGLAQLKTEEALADAESQSLMTATAEAALEGSVLARRLLALARRPALHSQCFEVGALLDDMRSLLQRTLGKKIRITIKQRNDSIFCVLDRAQLESAILGLALNSRDAMPDGGELTIEAGLVSRNDIRIPGTPTGRYEQYVEVLVRDTGVGIATEVLPRVSDPLFTLKESGKGAGLGLSTVRGFARQCHGDVLIHSQVGVGTQVRVYLPASDSPQSPPSDPSDRVSPRGESSEPASIQRGAKDCQA